MKEHKWQRRITGAVFALTGVLHFTNEGFFEQIVPPPLPAKRELVYVSGVFEVLGGLGLIIPATRRLARLGLVALLLAVYPANIYHALGGPKIGNAQTNRVYHLLRLPLQFAFIWWVLRCSRPAKKAA